MSEDPTPIRSMQLSIARSPGLILVTIGFMLVYLIIGFGPVQEEPTLLTYSALAFAFLLAAVGMVFMYRELQSADAGLGSLPESSSDLEHAVDQLSKNYDILRRQATQGFVLAGTFMALGILVILSGAVGELFGLTKEGANLTTVAGIVIEAISGIGMYLFRSTFLRLNAVSDRLHETWRILAAFRKTENLPDQEKTEVTVSLINRLVEPAGGKAGS